MFRACSTCKKPIPWRGKYYVCSVSTCNARATSFVFCTLDCWDAHVPTFRHKDAWAEEKTAPAEGAAPTLPEKPQPSEKPSGGPASEDDILIVASKLKAYIKAKSGMSTSANAMEKLSDKVRAMSDKAIHRAELAGRKTVMDRDVE